MPFSSGIQTEASLRYRIPPSFHCRQIDGSAAVNGNHPHVQLSMAGQRWNLWPSRTPRVGGFSSCVRLRVHKTGGGLEGMLNAFLGATS